MISASSLKRLAAEFSKYVVQLLLVRMWGANVDRLVVQKSSPVAFVFSKLLSVLFFVFFF